jgi:hypothetical protein
MDSADSTIDFTTFGLTSLGTMLNWAWLDGVFSILMDNVGSMSEISFSYAKIRQVFAMAITTKSFLQSSSRESILITTDGFHSLNIFIG